MPRKSRSYRESRPQATHCLRVVAHADSYVLTLSPSDPVILKRMKLLTCVIRHGSWSEAQLSTIVPSPARPLYGTAVFACIAWGLHAVRR